MSGNKLEKIKIRVTPDKLKAFITILPLEEGEILTKDDIKSALENAKIKFGIKDEVITSIVELLSVEDILIAEGIPPENGEDAKIKYFVSLGNKELTPKENPDGTVDFREIGFVENVKKGDVLAEKIPPTEGKPGTNVYGESIPPRRGRDIRLPKGKNTEISEDGMKLIASISGIPIGSEGNISVSPILEIQRDVDFSTGNIDFVGSVLVKGTIRSHFKVKCENNLEVWEDIENADVEVGRNLIVRRGIYGEPGRKVIVGGNLIAKIIRNVELEVHGDILVEQGIVDSNVKCGGTIRVSSNRGMISGGNIWALKSVYTAQLGSPYGTRTVVIVGKEPWKSEELDRLVAEREDIKKKLEDVNTNIKYLAGYGREENLPDIKRTQLSKLREIQKLLIEQLNLRDIRIKELGNEILQLIKEAKIQVTGMVYPGVKIWIGNESYLVNDELQRVYFVCNEGRVEFRAI
ncbi:DUF342 domain-containing protein [bacterium]|nr:DUF342 domain-containing protein [bacterium]